MLLELLLLLTSAAAPQASDKLVREFRYKRDLVLVDCAERHYKLAAWCWRNELLGQSTSEVLYALELSDQRHTRSREALSKMQALDDAFWQEERDPPSRFTVRDYAKKAARARETDLEDHVELAGWAVTKGLSDEARGLYERVLRIAGEPLELDDAGRIVLARKKVPEELSAAILAGAVEINGRMYLRDEFLRNLSDMGPIFEAGSEELRVRSPLGAETVEDLHALGSALLPVLERDLAGKPTKRMDLFVFATRAAFDEYLTAAGLERYLGGSGVADRGTYTALVCAEGRGPDDLRALCLHELTHLYHYGLTRGVLPDWYEEGLAETYGGQGTFTWDGETLEVGGAMAEHRLEPVKDPEARLPLSELLGTDAAGMFVAERSRALVFYAQAWAFLRYLREGADLELTARFRRWELTANGASLGARAGELRTHDASAAQSLFTELVAGDLEALERGFAEWLAALD
jgi:hypothetical protein